MKLVRDIFTSSELEELRALPQVQNAYEKLQKGQKQVYFTIPFSELIQQHLADSFNLTLSNISDIPCRWIRGDTAAHIDRGQTNFQDTYLVYLTDGEGTFEIEGTSYPIVAGTGFQFSEGLQHEAIHTNNTSRLLLGPMSEAGFAVGTGSTISADGATQTLYLRSVGSGFEYSFDTVNWNSGSNSTPFTITNTNGDPANNILKVIFQTNFQITLITDFLICGSDGIQFGDDATLPDGTLPVLLVNLSGGGYYTGLIQNGVGMSSGHNSITVQNLHVEADNATILSGPGQGAVGGWIGQSRFANSGTNCLIQNCTVVGSLNVECGGIVGGEVALESGELTIKNCRFELATGATWQSKAGGIVGSSAGLSSGTVTVQDCSSKGTIGLDGGGIFGSYAGNTSGTCTAERCYSEGTISDNAGGIFGTSAGLNGGIATAQSCYSVGVINTGSGGIFGASAGDSLGTTTATNCYTTGYIGVNAGGIYGLNYTRSTAYNCYTIGAITGGSSSGEIYSNSLGTFGPTNFGEDGAGWHDTNSAQTLLGVPTLVAPIGTTWVQPNGADTAYLLVGIGYSPYSTELVTNFTQTVIAGSASPAALLAGYTYSILSINGENPANYTAYFSIEPTTGVITVNSATPLATYVLYILNEINPYAITTFTLTVNGVPVTTTTTTQTCCGTQSNLTFYQYRPYNEYAEGTVIVNDQVNNTRRKFGSYDLYNKFLTGLAYRR